MPGSYRVVPHPMDEENPIDVGFHVIAGLPVSDADRQLAAQISRNIARLKRSARSLTSDWRKDIDFRECYNAFLDAARAGVEEPNADLGNGIAAVAEAEETMLQLIGKRVRSKHIREMSRLALVLGVISLVAIAAFSMAAEFYPAAQRHTDIVQAGCFALLGIAGSVWLSSTFYVRKVDLSRLDYMDPDGFSPLLRYALITVITWIVMTILAFQVITLGLGSVLLNEFTKTPSVAILIGLLCGLAEVTVTEIIVGVFNVPEVKKGSTHVAPSQNDPIALPSD